MSEGGIHGPAWCTATLWGSRGPRLRPLTGMTARIAADECASARCSTLSP